MALSKVHLGRIAEDDTITSTNIGSDVTNNDVNEYGRMSSEVCFYVC